MTNDSRNDNRTNLAGNCHFSTKPIPQFSRHYAATSDKGKTFLIHPSSLGFAGCPVISVSEFEKLCHTFPKEWKLLPDECTDRNRWDRVSKFCSFSKHPIPDGVPFYYTPNHTKSNNNPYYLISSVLGFRKDDEVPRKLDIGHLSLVKKTLKTTTNNKYKIVLDDGAHWAVIDKFCYWTTGPINDRVDIYHTCTLNEVEKRCLSGKKTLHMLSSHQVGSYDDFFHNHDISSVAFRSEADLIRHEVNLGITVNDFVAFKALDERRYSRLPVTTLDPSRWRMVAPPAYARAREVALQRIRSNAKVQLHKSVYLTDGPQTPNTQPKVLPFAVEQVLVGAPPNVTISVPPPQPQTQPPVVNATAATATAPPPPPAAARTNSPVTVPVPTSRPHKTMLMKAARIRAAKLRSRQAQEILVAERAKLEEVKGEAVDKSRLLKAAGIRAAKLKSRQSRVETTVMGGGIKVEEEEEATTATAAATVGAQAAKGVLAGVASHKMKMMAKIKKKRVTSAAAAVASGPVMSDLGQGATNEKMTKSTNVMDKMRMQAKIAAKRRNQAASAVCTVKAVKVEEKEVKVEEVEVKVEEEEEVRMVEEVQTEVQGDSRDTPTISAPTLTTVSSPLSNPPPPPPVAPPTKQFPTSPIPSRLDLLDPELHRGSWERMQMSNIESFPEEGILRAALGRAVLGRTSIKGGESHGNGV
jgi:hypothetical protein